MRRDILCLLVPFLEGCLVLVTPGPGEQCVKRRGCTEQLFLHTQMNKSALSLDNVATRNSSSDFTINSKPLPDALAIYGDHNHQSDSDAFAALPGDGDVRQLFGLVVLQFFPFLALFYAFGP